MDKPDTRELEDNELHFLEGHRSATYDLPFGQLYVSSDPSFATWNFLARFQPGNRDLGATLAMIEAVFADWKRTPCLKLTPDSPADLESQLVDAGWTQAVALTHMLYEPRSDTRATSEVTVTVCERPEQIETFSRVQSAGFGSPEWFDWVHKVNLLNAERDTQRFYLAERNGKPVGVCLLVTTPRDRIGGLYAVATLPEERGHGVAAALVDTAIRDSERMGNSRRGPQHGQRRTSRDRVRAAGLRAGLPVEVLHIAPVDRPRASCRDPLEARAFE